MANTLWTPTQAARSTLAAVRYLSTLTRTVYQDYSTEFVAGRGQTISILSPITAGPARVYTEANRQARDAIIFDDLAQTYATIEMRDQVYKAIRLPDNFNTFTLTDLEGQVLRPQAEAVVDGIAKPLIEKMNGIAVAPTAGGVTKGIPAMAADGSNVMAVFIAAKAYLDAKKVPVSPRYVAVSPQVAAAILSLPQLQKANEAGTDGLLREATLGKLMGFTIVEDSSVDGAVFYHGNAFALVTRPSRNPEGAAKSATVAQDGFALRWLMHYNPLQLEDQSVVDAFVGASVLAPDYAVRIANPA